MFKYTVIAEELENSIKIKSNKQFNLHSHFKQLKALFSCFILHSNAFSFILKCFKQSEKIVMSAIKLFRAIERSYCIKAAQ